MVRALDVDRVGSLRVDSEEPVASRLRADQLSRADKSERADAAPWLGGDEPSDDAAKRNPAMSSWSSGGTTTSSPDAT